jgi:hypothetical protein
VGGSSLRESSGGWQRRDHQRNGGDPRVSTEIVLLQAALRSSTWSPWGYSFGAFHRVSQGFGMSC